MADSLDFVIAAHPKDYTKLPFVVHGIRANSINPINKIYLVGPRDPGIDGAIYLFEEHVLPRPAFRYRPNWLYAQYLKLFFPYSEKYVFVDADLVFNRPRLFDSIFIFRNYDQNHQPYFAFSERMFGFGKVFHRSFITDFLLVDSELRNRMITSRFTDLQAYIDRSVEVINDSCYPAEAELYCTWCLLHADEFKTKYLNHISLNKNNQEWTTDEIAQAMRENQDKDTIAVHSWADS